MNKRETQPPLRPLTPAEPSLKKSNRNTAATKASNTSRAVTEETKQECGHHHGHPQGKWHMFNQSIARMVVVVVVVVVVADCWFVQTKDANGRMEGRKEGVMKFIFVSSRSRKSTTCRFAIAVAVVNAVVIAVAIVTPMFRPHLHRSIKGHRHQK